jgi:hypothetical protein
LLTGTSVLREKNPRCSINKCYCIAAVAVPAVESAEGPTFVPEVECLNDEREPKCPVNHGVADLMAERLGLRATSIGPVVLPPRCEIVRAVQTCTLSAWFGRQRRLAGLARSDALNEEG